MARSVLAALLALLLGTGLAAPAIARPAANGDRARLIERFPEDVRPLLANLPAGLIELLWEVRQEGPDTLTWQDAGGNYHDSIRRAFVCEWSRITGWQVNAVTAYGDAESQIVQQVEAGTVTWDVSELLTLTSAFRIEEYLAPIGELFLARTRLEGTRVRGRRWAALLNYGTMLVYNNDVYRSPRPRSVSDIFDTTTFPGKRCVAGFARSTWPLETALLADGVPFGRVYNLLGTARGRARALAKWDTIRDDIVYWNVGREAIQFVLDGQCEMSLAWNGRAFLRVRDEPELPLGAAWSGSIVDAIPFVIPRGAPHANAARSALAYALRPRNQCDLMNETGYGLPFDDQPFPSCLSDFAQEWAPHAGQKLVGPPDPDFYLRRGDAIERAWGEWIQR